MQVKGKRRPRNVLIVRFAFVFYYLGEGSEWVIAFPLCRRREVILPSPSMSVSVRSRRAPVGSGCRQGPACPVCWVLLAVGDCEEALQ